MSVAEKMGNPYIFRGSVNVNTFSDFNDVTTQGYYRVESVDEIANNPGINWCTLLVFGNSVSNDFVSQIAANGTTFKFRMRSNKTSFSSWKTLSLQ